MRFEVQTCPGGDWVEVRVDGKLVHANHSLESRGYEAIITALGYPILAGESWYEALIKELGHDFSRKEACFYCDKVDCTGAGCDYGMADSDPPVV